MTRGRKPLIALSEAEEIAAKRGVVLPTPGKRGDHFDLIIFEEQRVVFVRVKRTVTNISNPLDVLHRYQREITHLTRVPQTAVAVREFWVRSPRGSWQFFLILHDSIVEIQSDGKLIQRVDLPLFLPAPATDVPASTLSTSQDPTDVKG
jgi:hypothetical protein